MRPAAPAPHSIRYGMILGGVLLVVGSVASIITALAHWTSLLPAFFGSDIVGFAFLGRNPEHHRIAIYGIGTVAFLGALGSLRGIPNLFAIARGQEVGSPEAVISQAIVLVIGVILVALVLQDMRTARRAEAKRG